MTTKGLYLVDSGGQYRSGTTDVTRTTSFGPCDNQIRRTYTAVLKGLIAILTLRFPRTRGHHIDAFARRYLWDLVLDYDHGVGHSLLVHEHPHRIGKMKNPVDIFGGMVLTIEPGCYQEGEFGIRLENQVEVVKVGEGYLGLDSLTAVPIDLSLALPAPLSHEAVDFLDQYHARVFHHARVFRNISPLVEAETREWLAKATAPLSNQVRANL